MKLFICFANPTVATNIRAGNALVRFKEFSDRVRGLRMSNLFCFSKNNLRDRNDYRLVFRREIS